MKNRRLKDVISGFIDYLKNSESPDSYILWSGVAAISAALQRQCRFIWEEHSPIFPNIYVVLVGPSGKARKSQPMAVARSLIERLQIPMIGEDNSMEAVIRTIKNAERNYMDKQTGRIHVQSAICGIFEELAVFTGQQNTPYLAMLTNWFDSRDNWKRTTKHQGTDDIKGMCFTLLAATAPDWLPHILSREAIGGGFTSRCIFVVEEGRRKIVADPTKNRPSEQLYKDLTHDLQIIKTMAGEFKFDKEAHAAYCDWYERENITFDINKHAMNVSYLHGYFSRRFTHVKKLGMILSASRGDDYTVTLKDFQRAKAMLEMTEKKMPKVFAGIGRARFLMETQNVLEFITRRGGMVTKEDLYRQFYRDLDEWGMDIVTTTLRNMGAISEIVDQSGDRKYRAKELPVVEGEGKVITLLPGGD